MIISFRQIYLESSLYVANAEKLLGRISFKQETDSKVWVGLNWPQEGWARLS